MQIIYGTGNPAKLAAMQRRLAGLDLDIIGLKDVEGEIPAVPETGKSPMENARQKALAYYDVFQMPVFSCDSGLYFENVPDEVQPGVHVRNINGKCLSDEEMIAYYGGLKYGDLVARYRNAICLVVDEEHIYEAMEESMASEKFLITSKPHPIRKPGFPLDSLSVDVKTGKYYYDSLEEKLDVIAVEDGFWNFFVKFFESKI